MASRLRRRIGTYFPSAGAGAGSGSGAAVGSTAPVGGSLLFFDDFDYTLDRVQSSTTKRTTLQAQGYTFYKDENYSSGSNGYIYTATSVSGYTGTLPGTGPRTMVFESRGGTEGQTDYYVQLGEEVKATTPADAYIPANVWFQFWHYLGGSTPPVGKWLYPAPAAPGTRINPSFPASVDEMPWLLTISQQTFEPSGTATSAAPAGWYTLMCEAYGSDVATWPNDVQWKLGPNLRTGNNRWLPNQTWHLHKLHFDTSGANGTWEWWVRAMGTPTWTKMAEYIGGTTPNFSWPVSTLQTYGTSQLRMPVTNSADSFQYLRDFAIATDESALPTYGSY